MAANNRWRAALRCYACGAKFTVEHLAFRSVSALALVVPCPSCGARPVFAALDSLERRRIHSIVELSDEPEAEAEAVRLVLRFKPEWYNRLAARALPGSPASSCLKASIWMDGEYLLRLNADGLLTLAALAEESRCPEAIEAMRDAYRAAIHAA